MLLLVIFFYCNISYFKLFYQKLLLVILSLAIVEYFRLFIISGYCWQFYQRLLLIILDYLSLVAIVGNFIIGYFLLF
jgi:hypothetical protein